MHIRHDLCNYLNPCFNIYYLESQQKGGNKMGKKKISNQELCFWIVLSTFITILLMSLSRLSKSWELAFISGMFFTTMLYGYSIGAKRVI